MRLDDYDYKFAYTVGASCDIDDLHLDPPKTAGAQRKVMAHMAVIMSKAYEDKMSVEDPEYKRHAPLTLQQVRALDLETFDKVLIPEVDSAVKAGSYQTVETAPSKNAKGAAQ